MEKQVIQIETQKPKPLHCDLCGKEVPIGRMMVGGPFKALCKDCDELANKAIRAYVEMIMRNPLLWFARKVVETEEDLRVRNKNRR